MNDQNPEPTPVPATTTDPTPEQQSAPSTGRFAVYDKTHARFVGPVYGKKAEASAALKERKKASNGHDFELREV